MVLLLMVCGFAEAKTKAKNRKSSHTSTKTSKHTRSSRHSKRASRKSRGQQNIDSERVREIQAALIREHYLQGEPTGEWDSRSKAAMQKFQADQGWQSKIVPDSRALIKLGLGPDHVGLLNPETAAIQQPVVPGGGTQ